MKALRDLRWLLLLALTGAACSSILGIEDIHRDPKSGTGDGGDGNGGTGGGKGGTSGTSGSTGKGGTSGTSGSTGVGGTSGDAGGGGDGDTGGTGTGGSGGAGDDTVRGKVVSHWRQPIPNVLVTIGAADALTDANGEFEIPDVAPQYDAAFTLTFDFNGTMVYGWVYQGLTRRDPTLMAINGLTARSGTLDMTFNNLVVDNTRKFTVAAGGPSDTYWEGITSSPLSRTVNWLGPATTTATVHGLLWEHTSDLPTVYRSHASALVALTENGTTPVALDMADANVSSGTIQGAVTTTSSDERANQVFVRFNDHATIQLVDDSPPTDPNGTFTYTVPSIPGSSIMVSASEDGATGYGVVHRDGLAAGANNIALAIPQPVLLNAPAPGVTNVDGSTMFRWNGSAGAYLWYIEDDDYFQGLRIITSAESGTVPVMPDGFALRANGFHFWRIQTHGSAASVDDMCGPEGFADSFGISPSDIEPVGPRQGDGSYTVSLPRFFTTAQ
jgi:hypothetical protein